MTDPGLVSASSAQLQLSGFLHAELLHTLGSYQIASEKLTSLLTQVGTSRADTVLRESIESARDCNEHLRDGFDRISPAATPPNAPEIDPDLEAITGALLLRVSDFYRTSARALHLLIEHQEGKIDADEAPAEALELGRLMAITHDPQRRGAASDEQKLYLMKGRLDRARVRLDAVNRLLPHDVRPVGANLAQPITGADMRDVRAILNDHIGVKGSHTALHLTAIEAMSYAHSWMHHAENLRLQSFGDMFTSIPETTEQIDKALERAIALNTFVHVVGRSAAWIFAENTAERDAVRAHYEKSCRLLTPTYCMWIGAQINLLALHRRAYTWWSKGDRDRAYRDFYKLTRFLRDLRTRVDRRATRVPGTRTLVEGLTAMAEHHIGRIYRGQHAHRIALKYFKRASRHLEGWEEHEEIGPILRNSRWRLNLLISQGKANYELGRAKLSLQFYVRAWRAFLQLSESETHTRANLELATELMAWLTTIEEDPELSKTELSHRMKPLVEQFETISSPVHLRRLAADIMMRVGHLLFILKMPPLGWVPSEDPDALPPQADHQLAFRCLMQASELDPTSTLIATDLLRIRHNSDTTSWPERLNHDPTMKPFAEQWPSGGGRFEEAARVIEFLLQKWIAPTPGQVSIEGLDTKRQKLARELLGSFLAHTDSSNVKLAQVYQYLMQGRRGGSRDVHTTAASLDVVCLRRYSSFFPFLPRPAAFRAPGGGYLVQVQGPGEDIDPFGIAIDPGPDFLDNLYKCGYGLADIQMVVLTHDHADHMASLDAMLTLLGIRMALGDKTFSRKREECLAIVGNASIVERYGFFNKEKHPVLLDEKGGPKERSDPVKVLDFKEIQRITAEDDPDARAAAGILLHPTLSIEPVRTVDHTDATGYLSQGFLLSVGSGQERTSVLFTGDTGPEPSDPELEPSSPRFSDGKKSLKEAALEADVVVAHLSSVPLRELRELAGDPTIDQEETTDEFEEIWRRAEEQIRSAKHKGAKQTEFLLEQLQFGFRTRPNQRGDLSVSPLSPVEKMKVQSVKHLYLTGLLDLADHMARGARDGHRPLLLIGELREELGTFRTRIADRVTKGVFAAGDRSDHGVALTADIGLRVRLTRGGPDENPRPARSAIPPGTSVLCTTCDLDNDLVASERFHAPHNIREVCVKGENEGVFYNCLLHDPGKQLAQPWVEAVERYDVFMTD